MPNNQKTSLKQGGENPDTSRLPNGYDHNRLASTEAVAHFNQKSLLTSTSHYDVLAYEHAIAFTVAGLMEQDLLQDTYQLMQQAIKDGTPFYQFKKQLMPQLAKKGWLAKDFNNAKDHERYLGRRVKTIYHTNKQTAYAAGRWQRIQNSKDGLPYLQYMPSVSANKRDNHKQFYGLVRPVDDPIWANIFPPNNFGCKCWVKQLSTRQAQKIGISEPITLEHDTVQNPHTGEMIKTTKGVHFSFNHNHDRLTALLKLAEDKHGVEFAQKLGVDLKGEMVGYAQKQGVSVVNFSHLTPRKSEVGRLAIEPIKSGQKPKTPRYAEGALADLWQQYFSVQLVRYDDRYHKTSPTGSPPDFAQKDHELPIKTWLTLDMMYTLESGANIDAYLHSLTKSDIAWQKQVDNIIAHIEKSDIVPLDLRHFDTQRLVKIIGFVLSLSQEQRQKIVIIGE